MHWLETLRAMDGTTLALCLYTLIATIAVLLMAAAVNDWRRRFNAVRKYADEVKEQNEAFRKMLEGGSYADDGGGGEIVEVPEDERGPGPGETIH